MAGLSPAICIFQCRHANRHFLSLRIWYEMAIVQGMMKTTTGRGRRGAK